MDYYSCISGIYLGGAPSVRSFDPLDFIDDVFEKFPTDYSVDGQENLKVDTNCDMCGKEITKAVRNLREHNYCNECLSIMNKRR